MEPIYLQTFCHEVGGGKSVMNFNNTTLCKLLNAKEHYFYVNMPKDLHEFTPEFRGVIKVTFQEDSNGYIQYICHPPDSSLLSDRSRSSSIQRSTREYSSGDEEMTISYKYQKKHNGCSCNTGCDIYCSNYNTGSIEAYTYTTTGNTLENKESQKLPWINPWTTKNQDKLISKIKTIGKDGKTCRIHAYGDDDTKEVKQRSIKKCQIFTSSIIGIRIDGMQVFRINLGKYIHIDKYYGRYLPLEGVKQTLYQFLHNGCTLRSDVIVALILKLKKLYKVLNEQKGFRFYSTSLLIVYEGYQSPDEIGKGQKPHLNGLTNCDVYNDNNTECKIDTRMIDFTQSTHADLQDEKTTSCGPDIGYLFGLGHLIELITNLKKK